MSSDLIFAQPTIPVVISDPITTNSGVNPDVTVKVNPPLSVNFGLNKSMMLSNRRPLTTDDSDSDFQWVTLKKNHRKYKNSKNAHLPRTSTLINHFDSEISDRVANVETTKKSIDWSSNDHSLVSGLMSWRDLAIATVQRIWTIDSQRTIICEASPIAVSTLLPKFEPLPFDNIIYSFHMYEPYDFTYQNLNFNVTPIYYPDPIRGTMWNKDKLRSLLQPNVDWQQTHNVSIYVGEFSAIHWAPGNSTANYLNDLIELYEEFGWIWTYHCFREFQGWDVEMIGGKDHPQRSSTSTDRQLYINELVQEKQFLTIHRKN